MKNLNYVVLYNSFKYLVLLDINIPCPNWMFTFFSIQKGHFGLFSVQQWISYLTIFPFNHIEDDIAFVDCLCCNSRVTSV